MEDEEDIDFDDDDFEGDSPSPYSCVDDLMIMADFSFANMYEFDKPCTLSLTKNLFSLFCLADDEEDMLEHYLAEKSESPSHS